uniref:Zinc finger E-box binding homeobox 1 n=1 Tax=Poecilia formosa TaxID=48698 RepID=A0A087Y7X5_POEFO
MSTCAVTNFNNGLEASSDSDDEDKLHIVEEDSLLENDATETDGATALENHDAAITVLPHNGSWNGDMDINNGSNKHCLHLCDETGEEKLLGYKQKEEEVQTCAEGDNIGGSDIYNKPNNDALVEEILQQSDTAIIYPEAPEDEQSPAETGDADENGTPDSFSHLHICPYCSRGYKRNASLKEHIKYRHETSEDNYSCSQCSYTFTYRSQLERHMSHHRGNKEQRHVSQSTAGSGGTGGTRKFKCTECSKAFKYKHHLKEHLRIHSVGEKPYECSNCKKRFSHSGSYSSHISSKKCVGAATQNSVTVTVVKTTSPSTQTKPVAIAPARLPVKEKTESKPLQEQLPVTQIKSEPVEYECKPVMAAPATSTGSNGVVNGGAAPPAAAPAAAIPQSVAMVVPTVGLMSPVSINLNDLQSVLKVAMDGNVLRQVLGSANGVVAQGKQGIVVQQPQQQIISLPAFVDHDGTTKIIINYSISPAAGTAAAAAFLKKNPVAEPMKDTKTEATAEETVKESKPANVPKSSSSSTCLLCDDCPDNLEALHLLQHRKAANGEAVDSAALDPSFAALLSEAGVMLEEPPVEDLLSLLKTYFASNANPGEEELTKISKSVNIPTEVVKKWFIKMNSGKNTSKCPTESSDPPEETKTTNSSSEETLNNDENGSQEESDRPQSRASSPSDSLSLSGDLVIVKSEPEDPEEADSQAEPLDLSLPKHEIPPSEKKATPPPKQQEHPLNLTCLRKDGQTLFVTTPQSTNPVNIVTAAQLPTLVAIAGQGTVGCLSAINTTTKRTILIPQLTYTYAAATGNAAGAKTVVLNGHKEKRSESNTDGASSAEEQDSKKRRVENGVYPCDLCSKVFQKGSSLLRHKYEHTGKRPHECTICNKAFKHKHHLIEHSRLHSGEKPYQCDKCGKRFSHSGSYSQHMNHRYSYCKKDWSILDSGLESRRGQLELGSPGGGALSDSRTTTPQSQMDSDERESEEEDDEAMDFFCDVVEVELGNEHAENGTSEGKREEKEEPAGAAAEKRADCEAETDKVMKEESDSTEEPQEAAKTK